MNNAELYKVIEAKGSFRLPAIYRQLHDDEVLYEIVPEEWQQHWREWSITRPLPLLNHPERLEWFSLAEIADFEQPKYWREDLTFVPFAHNGAGDWWCWLPQWTQESHSPIVFTPHDFNQSNIVSPDFEGFLFRMCLETLARAYPSEFSPSELEQSIRTDISQLLPYLRPSWQNILNEVTGQEYQRKEEGTTAYTEVFYGFCPETEAQNIIRRELAFERLDDIFEHMKR